jgi:hypothetical protein
MTDPEDPASNPPGEPDTRTPQPPARDRDDDLTELLPGGIRRQQLLDEVRRAVEAELRERRERPPSDD